MVLYCGTWRNLSSTWKELYCQREFRGLQIFTILNIFHQGRYSRTWPKIITPSGDPAKCIFLQSDCSPHNLRIKFGPADHHQTVMRHQTLFLPTTTVQLVKCRKYGLHNTKLTLLIQDMTGHHHLAETHCYSASLHEALFKIPQ